MAIKDDITVMAGKKTFPIPDVETKSTVKHATTGEVYADEDEAKADINNPATDTTEQDIRRDVEISVNKLPNILGGTS
jgi:TusA-related sulfurtransferase